MSKPIYLFSTSSYPDTIHVNSLDSKLLKPDIDFSLYDYLIITSKQVAKALQQYEKSSFIKIPALCVSAQTAKSYEAIGGSVLKIGSGYGDTLKETIVNYPKKTKWLYLRAKEIASDFTKLCRKDGYEIAEAIMYETSCSEDIQKIEIESDAVLIFTSPSSVRCFLKTHTIEDTQKVIVIGKTTANAIPKNSNFVISSETTIESCVKIANTL